MKSKTVVVALFALFLLNALGFLNSVPAVYAASGCSSTGGNGGQAYYYGRVITNIVDYGVAGYINAGGWSYDSDPYGHMATWVNMEIDDGTNTHWLQVGLVAGYSAYLATYSASRVVYWEYQTASQYFFDWLTSDPIPGSDNNYGQVFVYGQSGSNYEYDLKISSTYYGATWTQTAVVATYATGIPYAASETYYTTGSNETCDSYNNTQSSLVYSSNIGTSPTWISWPNTASDYSLTMNSPYSISHGGTYAYWGES